MIPPSARRSFTSSVSAVTNLTKSSLSFSGKALWILSTSAFLVGVPWALAYAEEEQYIQLEREQGMIKGANDVSLYVYFPVLFVCFRGLGIALHMVTSGVVPLDCGDDVKTFFSAMMAPTTLKRVLSLRYFSTATPFNPASHSLS